jgi:hypothetical protein
MLETLTVLASVTGSRLGKSFIGPSLAEGPFNAGKEFNVSEVAVDGLAALASVLTAMEPCSDQTVIRGKPLAANARSVRRTQDHFDAVPRQWCMLDVDGLEWDGAISDPSLLIDHAIQQLPPEFQGIDCWYQFSSSMGIKPGIRVHLWYWLERPCGDDEMRTWLGGCPVDPRLFNPIQMHLTAAPQFKDGAVDPFPHRSGLFAAGTGKEEVSVPVDLATRSLAHTIASRPRGRTKSNQLDPAEVIRDPKTGLAIDGREKLMFLLSNEVAAELTTKNYKPTVAEITDALWDRFCEEADLSVSNGRAWSKADANQKATARKLEIDGGKFRFVSKSEKAMLLPAVGGGARPDLLFANVAQQTLNQVLDGFFDRLSKGKAPRATVRITMGAGKTHATIAKLKGYLKGRYSALVEIYVPRHDLGDEWREKLTGGPDAINADVIHVLPRTGGRLDPETNSYQHPVLCERPEYVRSLESKGHSVFGNACRSTAANARCKHFDECKYLKQFQQTGTPSSNIVRIYTHSSLFLTRNEFERGQVPNLVIIDEAFLSAAVTNLPAVKADAIRQWVCTPDNPRLGIELVECLKNQQGQFAYLEKNGIDSSTFTTVSLDEINPKPSFSKDATAAHNFKSSHIYKGLATLLEAARQELKDAGRTSFQQLVYDSQEDEVVVCEHRKVRLSRTTPVLYLDATADPLITDAYLPEAEMHRVDVVQQAVVSQVWDRTGSNSFWNRRIDDETANRSSQAYDIANNDLSALINILNEWVKLGEKPLVVGHKRLADYLKDHPQLDGAVKVAHFMSLRGSNIYENCSVIFVTGRNYPPLDEIERQARSVFGSSGEPLCKDDTKNLPQQQVDYWLSSRSAHGPSAILVPSFSDPRFQSVLNQIREAETLQAIARLRLVWAQYQKRVFLLSNLPVELRVDHLIEFDDLLPDRLEHELIKKGDLPLTAQGLRKMRPDLGYSEDAAKKVYQSGRSKASDPKSLLKQLPVLWRGSVQIATFKAGDTRKTQHTHLFLPKGYVGDPHAAAFQPWTEEEVLRHLETGWGQGAVVNLSLAFLYETEPGA